jgi:hypothetical protein
VTKGRHQINDHTLGSPVVAVWAPNRWSGLAHVRPTHDTIASPRLCGGGAGVDAWLGCEPWPASALAVNVNASSRVGAIPRATWRSPSLGGSSVRYTVVESFTQWGVASRNSAPLLLTQFVHFRCTQSFRSRLSNRIAIQKGNQSGNTRTDLSA